ncbi:MAG TPA: hypothetical protein VI818_06755 [Candidatus Thermoplasmatota archaeon]|nr:hypothetical protein [Candidatus Thermoplasmatota archaeon]
MTLIRGKDAAFSKHASQAMAAERPPLEVTDVQEVLETPDHDDGHKAFKRIGRRTVLVYYEEDDAQVFIRSASATRRKLPP